MEGNSTQIDELRLDITVEDKTSGDSSDKRVRKLATAISTLNKNLKAFDNAKFSKTFENMAKGIEPFVNKIESVSSALESLATIVKKSGLDKAVEQVSGKMPELKTKNVQGGGGEEIPIQQIGDNANLLGFEGKLQILNFLIAEMQKIQDNANKSADKFFGKLMSKSEKTQLKIESLKGQLATLSEKLQTQKVDYASALMNGGDVDEIKKNAKSTSSEIHRLQKQLDKLTGSAGKTKKPLGQLLKSFGRIAMYRAVRRTIQEITQAFTESIDGIAKYNSEFRDTMGSLQSSLAKVKTSMGVAFYQVLILIEPLITSISNGIVNLANSLSKVTANLRGTAEYTKINTEYMKQYQSATQGALLSFDTFNTLNSNQGIDYSQMFDTGTDALDTEGFNETETVIKDLLLLVKELFKTLGTLWKTLKPSLEIVLDSILKFIPAIDKLITALAPVLNQLVETILPPIFELVEAILPVLVPIIEQIADALNSVMYLLQPIIDLAVNSVKMMVAVITLDFEGMFNAFADGWKNVGEFFVRIWKTIANSFASFINGIANIFIAFVNICIDGLNMILNPINAIGKVFGASDDFAQIHHWDAKVNWQPYAYANGGMFEGAGTMYALAGESGAEVVATGSAGTGVLNVDQFADAMVSALVRYGAARDTSNGTTIVLDGNKVGQLVASNVGFRNEANRRNAGLNWK